MQSKYVVLVTAVFSMCFGALLLAIWQGRQVVPLLQNEQGVSLKNTQLELNNKLLKQEINILKQQLLTQQTKNENSNITTDKAVLTQNKNNEFVNSIIDENLNPYLATKRSEDFQQWFLGSYKNKANFDLASEMQNRFEAEAIEPAWAQLQEQNIRNEFNNNQELAGAALKDIKCRSSQCQITINVADLEQANSWVNQTAKALNLPATQKMIIATPNITKNMTALYIDIGSEGFNFHEP